MPAKTQTEFKVTKSKMVKTQKEDLVTEPVKVELNQTAQPDKLKLKKSVRKGGRTLLVKSVNGKQLSTDLFKSLEGLQNQSETKASGSFFLTFDTVQNSVNALRKLRSESNDYNVKFSYYRLFFTVTGLDDSSDYNQVKSELVNYVSNNASTNVLYCKLYRKNDKYIGCGDLTVDTLEGMNKLLSKDDGLKQFTLGSLSGTFYRYNNKNEKVENTDN